MRCFFLVVLVCLFVSCQSVKYVPVETETVENNSVVKNDSIRTDKDVIQKDSSVITERIESRDSVIIRDSSVIIVNDQGEVLKTERYREKESYNTKELQRQEKQYRELETKYQELQLKYDALFNEKQKTKQVPYPVEKPLSTWQNLKLQVGGFAMSAIVVIILIIVGKMVYKLKK